MAPLLAHVFAEKRAGPRPMFEHLRVKAELPTRPLPRLKQSNRRQLQEQKSGKMEGIFLSSSNPSRSNLLLRLRAPSTPTPLPSRFSLDSTPPISSRRPRCGLPMSALIPASSNRIGRTRRSGVSSRSLSPISAESSEFDVVVVGAGIIGLTIARQFLLESNLSVAVVDARVPCSGATGAGTYDLGIVFWFLNCLQGQQVGVILAHSVAKNVMS
ncbi:hypothetical protein ACLOJK_009032 [Asimina triloba]